MDHKYKAYTARPQAFLNGDYQSTRGCSNPSVGGMVGKVIHVHTKQTCFFGGIGMIAVNSLTHFAISRIGNIKCIFLNEKGSIFD